MRKDSTSKKSGPRKARTTQKRESVWMEAELAAHIAAVIAHPYTPASLYNAIVETMADLDSEIPCRESSDTPEYIERILNYGQGFGYRNIGRFERERLPDGRVIARAVAGKLLTEPKGGAS